MKATLDETYTLDGTKFNHINEWFFWQEQTLNLDIPLETDAILGAVGEDGNMDRNAGFGHIRMDRENIHFKGECF
ncbi:hypothetical protein RFX70_18890, partial [Acinetobacter baumannii]|nr:hypothetical protein [Acinetobacter baumannii]